MLTLLKAEFEYYKISAVFYLVIFLIVDISFVGWGYDVLIKSYPAVRAAMILIMVALLITRQIKLQQEKMDRFYMKLPISLKQVAILRIIFLVFFWIAIFSLFWINYLIFAYNFLEVSVLADTVSLSGLLFAAIAVPLLHRDLNIYFEGKNQKSL
jgi:hypothetical protein